MKKFNKQTADDKAKGYRQDEDPACARWEIPRAERVVLSVRRERG